METEEIATRHQYIRGYIKKTNREELIRAIYQDSPNTDLIFGHILEDDKFLIYPLNEVIESSQCPFKWTTYQCWLSASDRSLMITSFSDNCLTNNWGGIPEDHIHLLKYDLFIPLFLKITEPFPLVSLWMETKFELITNDVSKMADNDEQNCVAYIRGPYQTQFFLKHMFQNLKQNNYHCYSDKEKKIPLDEHSLQSIGTDEYIKDLHYLFYIDVDGYLCEFEFKYFLAFLRPITPLKMMSYKDEQFIDVRFYVLLMVNVLKGFAVIEMKFDPLKLE